MDFSRIADGITHNLTGVIITVVILILVIVLITFGIIFLVRGIRDQIKFNKTVLPSLDLEPDTEEEDEDASAFDVDSVFDVDDDEGFESDQWFAKIREDEGRGLPSLGEQESVGEQSYNKSSDEFIDDSGDSSLDELMGSEYEEESGPYNPYEDQEETEKPPKKRGLPQL